MAKNAVQTNAENFGYFNPRNVYRPEILSIELVGEWNPNDGAINTYRITQNDGKIFDFDVKNGSGGSAGRSVESVEQIQISTESLGKNIARITLSDGTYTDVEIRNGAQGEPGPQGFRGPAGIDSVEASIGTNDPTQAPSVDKELTDGVLSLTFNNIKGAKGDPGVDNAQFKEVDVLPNVADALLDIIYLVEDDVTEDLYHMWFVEADSGTREWKTLGTTAIQLGDYATKTEVSQFEERVDDFETRVYGTHRTDSNTPYTSSSRWENSGGIIGIASASITKRVSAINVLAGSAIRVVSDLTGAYLDVGYFCNDNDAIVGTIQRRGSITTYEGVVPVGAKRLYVNFAGSFSVDTSGDIGNLSDRIVDRPEIQALIDTAVDTAVDEYGARDIEDNTTPLGLSEDNFVLGNLDPDAEEISATNVIRSGFIEVVPGAGFTFQTSNSYRCDIYMYDSDKVYITHFSFRTGTYTNTLRERASYIRILLASPSGTYTAPVWDDADLSVTIYKKYVTVRATGEEDVQKVVNGYFDLELPIFAPSPQLPANTSEDSDFNAETITSTEIHTALDTLIGSISSPSSGTDNTPKFLTKYEVSGIDASGVYPIHTYAMGLRNRYAWRFSNELYAWKDGNNNIVFIDSCSPRIGDTIYSDSARTNSGKTVVSYNSGTGTMVDSASTSYTRSETDNVAADMFWTKRCTTTSDSVSTNITAYNRSDVSMGPSAYVDATHLSLGGKTYTRSECFDYHSEQKGTIFIWGNEHGPTSDPLEPSILLYRLAKDLCGGCRNNPFLMFIKQYFKIVFIPCANPWGCQYPRVYGRVNANRVNINRNYDTPGWPVVADTDKGSYAGDQNETQYIMNMCKRFSSDISIDIHCLGFGNDSAEGLMYLSETYIPDNATYLRTKKVMSGLGYLFDQRGNPMPESGSHGSEWMDYIGMIGGVFEMNAGAYSRHHIYDGKQHTASVMEACYTELLNCIRMWMARFDPTIDLSKLCIK